jgi:hypothetical protein
LHEATAIRCGSTFTQQGCSYVTPLRKRAELTHETSKRWKLHQASHDSGGDVKELTALSIFHSHLRSLPTSTAFEIHSTFVDWSPAFARFRPLPLLFVALFRTPTLISRPLVRTLCRQKVTSISSADQLPIAAIVTPGKGAFFFCANASMPPASQAWDQA